MLIALTLTAWLFSIIGSVIVLQTQKTNKRIISFLLALSSGIMISTSFLDILPESFELSKTQTSIGFIFTVIFLFITENFTIINSCNEFMEDCHLHTITLFAIIALFIHSLIDGFNIGISLSFSKIISLNISIAIILHKIADGITLASIMKQSSEKNKKIILMSILISTATPLGAWISYYLKSNLNNYIALAMSITAGFFTYISMTEIIPRLHKEKNYISPFIFLCGALIAIIIHILE